MVRLYLREKKITVIKKDGNISYIFDGVDKGIAFRNIPDNVVPCIDFYHTGDIVTFVE